MRILICRKDSVPVCSEFMMNSVENFYVKMLQLKLNWIDISITIICIMINFALYGMVSRFR